MSGSSPRAWLVPLSILVSAALFWLLFRQIDGAGLGTVLARADALRLGLAVLLSLVVNVAFSALALRAALAAHDVAVPLATAAKATLGHLALHAGASFVVGKAARALYLSRTYGLGAKSVLGAELTLLALKVAALLTLAATGALLDGVAWLVPGVAALLSGLVLWRRRRGAELGPLAASFGWALAVGLGQLGVFALALSALGATVPVAPLVGLFPLCLLGAKVPVALMGIGLRETLVVALFRGSAAPETLLGAALLFSLIEQVLPGLVGLAFAPRFVTRTLRG